MPPVKAAPTDPAALAALFERAGAKAGFSCGRFGVTASGPLVFLTKRTAGQRPRIYLSAGIHGDEPAPPLALLSLLESGDLDNRAVWFLCPVLNPDGLARGTRENALGIDLNRDYRGPVSAEVTAHTAWLRSQPNFDMAICVHEDWESTGFYLYELNPDKRASAAQPMITAAAKACPIDMSPMIEGREARGGIIRPVLNPEERDKWPESIYLQVNHTRLSYTIETPSSLPIEVRVSALRAALRAAIGVAMRGGR